MSQIIPDATVKTYLNQVKLKLRWFNSRNLTCHFFLSTQSPKLYLKYLTLKSTDGLTKSRSFYPSVVFHPIIDLIQYQPCFSISVFLGKCF